MQSTGMQIASFVGAMLILVGYAGHQWKRLSGDSVLYNALNAAGSGILAYIALRPFQLGFVVLEVSWVVISVAALVAARRKPAGRA